MSEVATVLSLYKNNRLEDVWESLDSLYRQTKKTDIFIQLDGTVPKEIENFLDSQLDAGKIEYLGKRNINLGIAKSHNELFEIVLKRGYRYIARMDTDDIAVPDRIEQQYIFMEQNPDIDVVGGYIEEFSDDTSYKKVVKYPLNHDEMFKFFSKRVPIANPTTFFRKTFFEKAGLYPITSPSNEDTLMWMNGFHQGCVFANIANILVIALEDVPWFQVEIDRKIFIKIRGIMVPTDNLKLFGVSEPMNCVSKRQIVVHG